jgi:hypothetical protein
VEKEWSDFASVAFKKGFPQVATVGSCALVAVVVGRKVYVANCGDSKAVLLSEGKDGKFVTKNVSTTFSINKASE